MRIFQSLEEISSLGCPVVLTIGNFDGVHVGHQAILDRCKELVEQKNQPFVLITFENHPAEVLRELSIPRICTLSHKILLLEQAGVDELFLLKFTKEFSSQTAEVFLKRLHQVIPFSHLILGYDASFGKEKQGDQQQVKKIAQALNFHVEYLPQCTFEGQPISSTGVRQCIQKGDLRQVESLLDRKYSIYGLVSPGYAKGHALGFPTVNLEVNHLCLPPLGVYVVKLRDKTRVFDGVANLGVGATIRKDSILLLEVHLLNIQEDFNGKMVEVLFYHYLRPEIQFESLTALKQQIDQDILNAKRLLSKKEIDA